MVPLAYSPDVERSEAEAFGAERFHLVGHDWGAVIGWWVAARHADRLARVVLMDGPHPDVGAGRPPSIRPRRSRAPMSPSSSCRGYTQLSVEPRVTFGPGELRDQISVPVAAGVGWSGFYEQGSGSRLFGSAGLAFEHPFDVGRTHLKVRTQMLALVRDGRLRKLDDPATGRHTVEPLGTIAISFAY